MKKVFAILILISSSLVAGTMTFDGGGVGTSTFAGSGGTASTADTNYDDILFYFNADSATSGQSPQKGSGTITIGGSWTTTTGSVSNALDNNNTGNSGGRITISTASNIDVSQGRVGFYFHPFETGAGSDGDSFYCSGATSTASLMWFQNSVGNYVWKYKDKEINVGGFLTANTTYFIELAWDSDEAELGVPCRIYLDGAIAGSCTTGSAGSDPTITDARFGGLDGNATDAWFDQILITNDPTRNLYSLRDQTSFP